MAKNKQPQPPSEMASTRITWDLFWFEPRCPTELVTVRVVTCLLAALWFATLFADTSFWFGATGWNAPQLARKLSVATEGIWAARFRITPLWSFASPITFQLMAAVGIVLCAVSALGLGRRWSAFALLLMTLFFAQRLTWATGAFEPYLVAVLGYLLIGPSSTLWPSAHAPNSNQMVQESPPVVHSDEPTWMTTFSLRLIQLHTYILLCFSLASMLSADTWWRGEAVWFLAASGHSNILSPEMLMGRELLVNLLSHAIVICNLIAVGGLWSSDRWNLARIGGMLVAAAMALIGDQLLYGALLATGVMSFQRKSAVLIR